MKLKPIVLLFSFLLSLVLPGASLEESMDQPTAFQQSYAFENQGQYSKGISVLLKVYSADSYEINLRLAWLSYLNGAYTESMSYYQKASVMMPYSLEARLGYVLPAAAVGNWEQVVAKYREVLQIDPKHKIANYRLASIYYNREEYAASFKLLKTVVNLYPFEYDSLVLFAWTHLKMGKTREAKVLFQKVLLVSPQDQSALEGLALLQ